MSDGFVSSSALMLLFVRVDNRVVLLLLFVTAAAYDICLLIREGDV